MISALLEKGEHRRALMCARRALLQHLARPRGEASLECSDIHCLLGEIVMHLGVASGNWEARSLEFDQLREMHMALCNWFASEPMFS